MKKHLVILLAVVGMLLTASCGSAGAVQTPPSGTVLFLDDFSNPNSGWGTWAHEGASIQYDQGGLRIKVDLPLYMFWSLSGKKFQDAQINVDAAVFGGPTNNTFGVLCRFTDEQNYYGFVISSDGYYGIYKIVKGVYSVFGDGNQLQYSQFIRQGQMGNRLEAVCAGERLALYANGELLTEVKDADLKNGQVGLLVGTYEQPGADIFFDNFVVKQP